MCLFATVSHFFFLTPLNENATVKEIENDQGGTGAEKVILAPAIAGKGGAEEVHESRVEYFSTYFSTYSYLHRQTDRRIFQQ